MDDNHVMTQAIVKTSIAFIWAVFGLCVGLAIGQLGVFVTIGKAVYDARVDQYQMDREIFFKEAMK
jgi:hypothetical protein